MTAAARRVALAWVAAALAGCALTPPQAPPLPTPSTWRRVPGAESADRPAGRAPHTDATPPAVNAPGPRTRWWAALADPLLDELVAQSLATAADVRTAQTRVREARARLAVAGAARLPSLSAAASANRTDASAAASTGVARDVYNAGFDASWEADLFGRASAGTDAARADLRASRASLDDARLSLAAEVARLYVQLRGQQARLDVAWRNLQTQSQTLQLTDWRAQAGLIGTLELQQARTAAEQTRAQVQALRGSVAQTLESLAVLAGQPAGELDARLSTAAPLPSAPATPVLAIPAETLSQRPDVRTAEAQWQAEAARTTAAQAARYPRLTLSGTLGLQALSASALGRGDAATSSLAASLVAPVFDGGSLKAQAQAQDAVQQRAAIAWEQTVRAAAGEVESALAALDAARSRAAALEAATTAAREAARLARIQYQGGVIDFRSVLDTERSLLSTEDSLAGARADEVTAWIRLHKALGGGWDVAGERDDPATGTPPAATTSTVAPTPAR
ncbi:MAG: efflux transporter outer membrane subunit [Pseudomonadota bacterium]